jgi:phospholipid/cholesterol/gamma-HCH transport system ATP-binding protein
VSELVAEISNLTTRMGGHVIHRDLDLRLERGNILALVGGSGSGKTTLLRTLIGLQRPVQGEVRLFGVSLASASPVDLQQVRRRLGALFQGGALFSALRIFDNIALPLRELHRLDEAMIRDLVMLKLHLVELDPHVAEKAPSQLSGGMVKRAALARALALDPELLVLDEPTAGLDPDRAKSFVRLIKTLSAELNLTVFMVTHDLDTLTTLATRVAVLAEQRVIAHGPLEEVLRVDHPFIERFFGSNRTSPASAAESTLKPAVEMTAA